MLRRAARESAELRRRHAHRATALHHVFEPDLRLAEERRGEHVERRCAVDLEHRANLQMVLQVAADAGQVGDHRNAMRLRQRRRPDAGKLQDLRRPDGAAAQHHLLRGMRDDHLVAVPHLDAGAALAAIGLLLHDQLGDVCVDPHLEVGSAVANRPQEGLGRVPAPAVLLVDLEVAHTFVAAAVEIAAVRNAGLLCCEREGIEDVPAQPLFFDAPFAAGAVHLVGTEVVVLVLLERRQHVLPAPPIVAGERGPLVVVARLAAHVDHAVDRRRTAQRLAARIAQRAAVEPGIRLGVVEPVGARVADAIQITDRNVNPVVVVLAAGLDQQRALLRLPREPVAHQGAGRAAADDDVVECGVVAQAVCLQV